MKKFFLIPLLACFSCVMAWGATVNFPGDGTYTTLADAVNAAGDDGKVVLTDHITLYSGNGVPLQTYSTTIDLNGYTITSTTSYGIAIAAAGKTLTIEDSSADHTGKIEHTGANYALFGNNGVLRVKGGTITTTGKYSIYVSSNTTLYFDDGTVSGPVGIQTLGTTTIANGTINGTTTHGIVSVGTLNITGGTIVGENSGVSNGNSMTVSGGSIEGGTNGIYLHNNVKNNVTSEGSLNMTGGVVTGATGIYASSTGSVTISGGTISSSSSTAININKAGCTLNMTGGTATGMWALQNYGTATITNGTLDGRIWGIMAYGGSTTTVDGDNVKIKGGSYGIQVGTKAGTTDVTVDFRAGAITSPVKCFQVYGPTDPSKQAVLTISGGTFTVTPTNPNSTSTTGMDVQGNIVSADSDRDAYNAVVNISGGTFSGGYSGVALWGKGAVANISGGSIDADAFAICGNGTPKYNGTEINITGGTIGSEETALAIYHPQYGTLNIENGTLIGKNSAIEMRAGTLTIDGGSFTATATTSSVTPNGNGTTTTGSAISIAQHTTKLPIAVTIDGGEFRAIYPIAQYNPQKNEEAYVNQVNITVNGGKFWATNTANVAAYTQDNKLTLNGGYYNLAPHAFVGANKIAKSNTDAASLAEGYLFEIGEYVEESKTTITDGNWVVETTWETTEVPTEVTAVTIPADGEVFIQPTGTDEEVVAYASSLDLEAGATLTIKDGATLVLGKDAEVDASANLVVEEGGQLLIAPTATPVQPVGSVTLVADGAGLKEGKSDHTNPANLYWQHFAIPTVGAPTSIALSYPNGTPITEAITYYNTWDIVNGWESIVKTDLTEPFVGYNFSNIKNYGTNVNYTFTGQLVGNASNPLNFTRRGFNFFGNSYLAPINIQALQNSMYEQGLEFTVYIFTKQGKRQTYRAINEVTASIYGIDEIKPLQGFFMFAEKATEADFQYNSAVYSAFINKQNGGAANNAPARRAASQYDAKAIIGIESAEGEYDEVVLVASNDFSDEYDLKADARKMENAGMNIYADGSFDYLAVMATNDLMGQTFPSKLVTKHNTQ